MCLCWKVCTPTLPTMEFTLSSFTGRLVLNPSDFILHLEHKDSARMYEHTFFDRDFLEVSQMGGLEFVGRLLTTAIQKPNADLDFKVAKETPAILTLVLTYSNPILLKPISLTMELPAARRATGSADVGELGRKLRETVGTVARLEETVKQINPSVQATLEKLMARLSDLEERTGDFVVLPGCEYAIPASLTSLKLVADGTCLLDNAYYSAMAPNKKIPYVNGHNGLPPNPFAWNNSELDKGSYGIVGNSLSLKNIKHFKHLTHLAIAGIPIILHIESLGKLKNLTHLTIISGHTIQWTYNSIQHILISEKTVPCTDISWVKNLPKLQTLILKGCKNLVDITVLKDMPQLKELDIRDTGVRNTDFLTNPSLKITK